MTKQAPPDNIAPPTQSPRTLDDARTELLADLKTTAVPVECARNRFNALHKPMLREVLLTEQREICIYCEDRIEGCDDTTLRIDHWIPLKHDQEKALTWENLHLSCGRSGTCDDHKGNNRLVRDQGAERGADLPWPCHARYQDWVGYSSGGEVYVRSDVPPAVRDALEMALHGVEESASPPAGILNLNHSQLVTARRQCLAVEEKRKVSRFGRAPLPAEVGEAEAAKLENQNPHRPFVSLRIAFWRGEIGKHR